MKRAWTSAAILFLMTGSFALDIRLFDLSDRTKFRPPLSGLSPYALPERNRFNSPQQGGLSFFFSHRAAQFNLLENRRHVDLSRVSFGGVQLDVAGRLAMFMEYSHFAGMINLARAGLSHHGFSNLRNRPVALQVGVSFSLWRNKR